MGWDTGKGIPHGEAPGVMEERDFRAAVERVVGPDFILEASLWLSLERLVWKRWEAGAQGDVGVQAKEGPVKGKW